MPVSTVADEARRQIVATATGVLTLAELREFVRTARVADRRHWSLIFDLTLAEMPISTAQVQGLVDAVGSAVKDEGRRGPVAIIAPDDAHTRHPPVVSK